MPIIRSRPILRSRDPTPQVTHIPTGDKNLYIENCNIYVDANGDYHVDGDSRVIELLAEVSKLKQQIRRLSDDT